MLLSCPEGSGADAVELVGRRKALEFDGTDLDLGELAHLDLDFIEARVSGQVMGDHFVDGGQVDLIHEGFVAAESERDLPMPLTFMNSNSTSSASPMCFLSVRWKTMLSSSAETTSTQLSVCSR